MVKNPPASTGDMSLIPGLRRFPREGNSNPLPYSCLGNPMDRGAWWATVHGVTKESDTAYQHGNSNKEVPHMIRKQCVCGEGKRRYSLHSMSEVVKLKLDFRNLDFTNF